MAAEHMAFKPAKGFYGDLTAESLDFLQGAFEDIWNAAGSPEDLNNLIDEDRAEEFLSHLNGSSHGWTSVNDNFGKKLYKAIDWAPQADGTEQQYRVTVIATKKGELKIDVRIWAAY